MKTSETHVKHQSFYKNSLERLLNKYTTAIHSRTTTNPGESLISRVTPLSHTKCSVFNNKNTSETCEETRQCDSFTGKKRITEIVPEESHALKLPGRDFKPSVLKNSRVQLLVFRGQLQIPLHGCFSASSVSFFHTLVFGKYIFGTQIEESKFIHTKCYFYKIQPPSLENWLILGLDQELRKMSLEHLAVPKSKEVIEIYKSPKLQMYAKGTEEPTERVHNGQSWNDGGNKIKWY